MTAARGLTGQRGWSQADWRRSQKFRDQHQRVWGASIEITTGLPTGLMSPHFRAPIMPPFQYFRFGGDEMNPTTFRIDYDAWLADNTQRWAEHRERIVYIGHHYEGDRFDPTKELSARVRTAVGNDPFPPELIKACAAGNKWALGLSDQVPPWAEKFRSHWETRRQETVAQWADQFPDAAPQPEEADSSGERPAPERVEAEPAFSLPRAVVR